VIAIQSVLLCYDPDEAGQKGAKSLAKRLGYNRCFNIVLPNNHDVNEFFNNGGDAQGFHRIMAHQKTYLFPSSNLP